MDQPESSSRTDATAKFDLVEAFETSLKQLRAPSKAVIGEAVRELFRRSREEADAAKASADQHQAELSAAFHAFLKLHEDTEAYAKLKKDHGRLLRLATEKGADRE